MQIDESDWELLALDPEFIGALEGTEDNQNLVSDGIANIRAELKQKFATVGSLIEWHLQNLQKIEGGAADSVNSSFHACLAHKVGRLYEDELAEVEQQAIISQAQQVRKDAQAFLMMFVNSETGLGPKVDMDEQVALAKIPFDAERFAKEYLAKRNSPEWQEKENQEMQKQREAMAHFEPMIRQYVDRLCDEYGIKELSDEECRQVVWGVWNLPKPMHSYTLEKLEQGGVSRNVHLEELLHRQLKERSEYKRKRQQEEKQLRGQANREEGMRALWAAIRSLEKGGRKDESEE